MKNLDTKKSEYDEAIAACPGCGTAIDAGHVNS
jgi:hypothetical protein